MKKAIITGATGMIGSELARQLARDGIRVYAVVRPNSSKIDNLIKSDLVEVIECDLHQLSKLSEMIESADIFYHFAWDGCYGDSRNDLLLQEQNVKGALEAVKAAKQLGCKKFVGAGSQAEFGSVEGKLSDTLPKNPVTGYGIAKHSAQLMTKALATQLGMEYCWGRILSCYGPGDNDYTMVMSAVVAMLKNELLAFTPGEQIWDYIYVEDCAKAFYLIGKEGVDKKAYTIGSGNTQMLKEYIYQIRDAIDSSIQPGIGERDYYPNQVMHLEADISELKKDTGFTPSVKFEEGIKHTVEWRKARL
ncbi:MAG: NAD(P)-dependent oxidoreductase [Pseudobutyrivibrio sp.]|nr:NAD(P)-dependent oxidoreductase [Pseudobutyrivibrio sp.]